MKVGYFVETPVEHNLTGGVRSFFNLVEVLLQKGVEPYVVTSEEWDFTEKLKELGVPFLTVKMLRPFVGVSNRVKFAREKYWIKTLVNRRAEIRATKWLKMNGIELIHINSQFAGIVGNKVAKNLNIPCVYHIREFLEEGFGVKFYKDKLLYDYVAKSNALIAISQSVKKYYEHAFKRDLYLVYNGLPVNENTYCEYRTRFLGDKINIAIIGRVTQAKGQLEIVKAVNELIKKYHHDNICLHIIGYEGVDAYELELKKFVEEKKIEEYVVFHPFTSTPLDISQNCDIGVLCSKSEAFGRVTVEYMLASLFVIGSNTGGTLEIIEDNQTGLLYNLGDVQNLAEKIDWVIRNPQRANGMLKKGQERAVELYSIESTAKKVLEIYKGLVKEE